MTTNVYVYLYNMSISMCRAARKVEQCRFSEMDLGLGGEALGMAEWLHFMLLRATCKHF